MLYCEYFFCSSIEIALRKTMFDFLVLLLEAFHLNRTTQGGLVLPWAVTEHKVASVLVGFGDTTVAQNIIINEWYTWWIYILNRNSFLFSNVYAWTHIYRQFWNTALDNGVRSCQYELDLGESGYLFCVHSGVLPYASSIYLLTHMEIFFPSLLACH